MIDCIVRRSGAAKVFVGGLAFLLVAGVATGQPVPDPAPPGEQTPYNKFLGPWKVIGPIDPGEKDQAKRMAQPYLGLEEMDAIPDSVTSGSQTFTAKSVAPGVVNIGLAFDREKQFGHAVAYAGAVIQSPDEREVLLSLGGDDGVIAWLNGEKVLELVKPNGVYIDDKLATVTLNPGSNHLLVKCDNISEDWGFSARILPVNSTHNLRLLYHIKPLPVALSNLPEAKIDFLNAAGEVLETQTVSAWKYRGSPTRAAYIAHTTLKEQPAKVAVEIAGPMNGPVFQTTFSWADAQDQVVGEPGTLTLAGQVVDAVTSAPLANATLSFDNMATSQVISGADGSFQMANLDPAQGRLYVNAPGHLETIAQVDLRDREPIVVRMQPGGVELSGTIRDEDGNPIKGAEVSMTAGGRRRVAASDNAGKYSVSGIKPSANMSVYPVVKHPEYQALGSFSVDVASSGTTVKDLVLKKGLHVQGRVTSEEGVPLAGVKITSGEDDFASNSANPSTVTDADGTYKLGGLKAGAVNVFAIHDDWAPALEKVTLAGADGTELNFKLIAGKPVSGKVVDADGKGVEGVGFTTDTWRDTRMFLRRSTTDADGKFKLNHMPDDVVETDFYKSGFASSRNVPLKGGDQNVSVTLQMPARIAGKVTDAETGDALSSFTLVKGLRWKTSTSPDHWQQSEKISSADGGFSFTETELSNYDRLLRVEADGYKTWEYPGSFKSGQQVQDIEAKLERAKLRSAIVVDDSGNPVAGATVHLFGTDRTLWLGSSRSQSKAKVFIAGADGRLGLPDDISASDGLYVEKEGIGATLHETPDITGDPISIKLHPFGSLSGLVFEGEEPQAGQQVVLLRGSNQKLQVNFKADTDGEGRFQFNQIPAGEYTLAVYTRNDNTGSYDRQRKVNIAPGENPPEILGGNGGTRVYGKVTKEGGEPLPGLSIRLSDQAGQSFSAYTDASGKFTLADIPPGEMTLYAQSAMRGTGGESYYGSEKVEVPEAESFEKNMALITRKTVGPGVVIKGIEGLDVAGTTITLADVKQPRVLLLQPVDPTSETAKDALTTASAEAGRLKGAGIGIVALVFVQDEPEATRELVTQFPEIRIITPSQDWVSDFYKRYSIQRDSLGVLLKDTGEVLRLVKDEAELKALKEETIQ